MDSIEERVSRGAELMDRKRPGWHNSIDLLDLDTSSCVTCILGQIYRGGATTRWDAYSLGLQDVFIPRTEEDASKHGFDIIEDPQYDWNEEHRLLTIAWKNEIEFRRAMDVAPVESNVVAEPVLTV